MAEAPLDHFSYLSDRVKLARYQSAIEKLASPEQVWLDLGCGSGVLGLMALRAGAGKVYFVDDGVVVEVARKIVGDAGFSDRAEFYQSSSFDLSLPERVDVIVCDHVGYFGIDYGILSFLSDARERFLKPGGIFLPSEVELKVALVESDNCRKLVQRWHDGSVPEEFSWLASSAANSKHGVTIAADDLVTAAQSLATLQLGDDVPPFLSWTTEFVCPRDANLDGLAGWFDCHLFDDVRMTNSPAAKDSLDRPQAYLPLETPISVAAGETIKVTVMVRHLDNIIGWVVEAGNERFTHNTFNGLFLDGESLARANPEKITTLNERGRARQTVLSYCDGKRTFAEVQAIVLRDHPNLFPSEQATTSFVLRVLSSDTGE